MAEERSRLQVAAVQASPVFLDLEATVAKTCRLIAEAASNGAKLIGFPECHVSGYPHYYQTFASNPLHEHGRWYRRIFDSAVEVPGPATERLCEAAAAAGACVVVGINEKDASGALYNSQLFIDARGQILGVHRKLIPTLFEKLVYATGDGSRLRVFDTPWGELGGLICGEHTSSLAKFSLIARREKIHVASWPAFPQELIPRYQLETVQFRVRQHAHEGKVFVISACGHFSDDMAEILCRTPQERQRVRAGGGCSAIIGVNGEFLAGPLLDEEGIVYADIDLGARVEASITQDVMGHSSRFDVLSLNFNERALGPLAGTEAPPGADGTSPQHD
jgi:aliphatic nitrilase